MRKIKFSRKENNNFLGLIRHCIRQFSDANNSADILYEGDGYSEAMQK